MRMEVKQLREQRGLSWEGVDVTKTETRFLPFLQQLVLMKPFTIRSALCCFISPIELYGNDWYSDPKPFVTLQDINENFKMHVLAKSVF